MRALDPEVVEAVWETVQPLIPTPPDTHPLGCHRRRISDRLCFWGMLVWLVTGASWVTVEAILERRVSDTTLRARRDHWVAAEAVGLRFLAGRVALSGVTVKGQRVLPVGGHQPVSTRITMTVEP